MKCKAHTAMVAVAAIVAIMSALPAAGQTIEQPRLTRFAETVFSSPTRLLAAEKISSEIFTSSKENGIESVVIVLADQADLSYAYQIADHDGRGWYVYRTLVEHANISQQTLKEFLGSRNVPFNAFWAANMIIADLDYPLAVEIAGRSDVARIDSNRSARWIEPPEIAGDAPDSSNRSSPEAIEWGVSNVNAPAVWALGHTGSGIVIGGLDTGIRWSHNAIKTKYRGWNGTTADHNYNWRDAIHSGGGPICGANTTIPCDDGSHGSHTVGTMVGDDGLGNQIGVAPGAKWIGCRNMDRGNGTPATYTECFQFMIAPTDSTGNNPNPSLRPHIVNNSWGCPFSEGCTTRAELETIVNNTQAAGIFVQASAGNSGGSGCSSVTDALAIYDASFSAGAIDINNSLAGFSSRGPSTFYNPNLLKPNLVAPGSNVRSIAGSSDTAYTSMSGTSMASPHVAGAVALLWSARPNLVRNIAATKTLLQETANPSVTAPSQTCGGISSTQIPNNTFGYGRVDVLAAINASASTVSVSGRVVTPEGLGLRNTVLTLIDPSGVRRTATTSSFGIFLFEGVRANESYTLTVLSKRYRFAPQPINVASSNFSAPDFVGLQ